MKRRNFLTILLAPILGFFRTGCATAAQKNLIWGTYGKPARLPLRWVKLGTQPQITPEYITAIRNILKNRGVQCTNS